MSKSCHSLKFVPSPTRYMYDTPGCRPLRVAVWTTFVYPRSAACSTRLCASTESTFAGYGAGVRLRYSTTPCATPVDERHFTTCWVVGSAAGSSVMRSGTIDGA